MGGLSLYMAERVGFEPTVGINLRRFSRPVLSASSVTSPAAAILHDQDGMYSLDFGEFAHIYDVSQQLAGICEIKACIFTFRRYAGRNSGLLWSYKY